MTVTVAIVDSRAEAELIVGMLRNGGVRAYISADDLGGVDLALQAQGVKILVSDADGQEAREMLGDSSRIPARTKPPNSFQRWLFALLGGNR